jgi:hypothetical protein
VKIRIDFTIEVPAEKLAELREFACATDNEGLRGFLNQDAMVYLIDYIEANVCDVKVARESVV